MLLSLIKCFENMTFVCELINYLDYQLELKSTKELPSLINFAKMNPRRLMIGLDSFPTTKISANDVLCRTVYEDYRRYAMRAHWQ